MTWLTIACILKRKNICNHILTIGLNFKRKVLTKNTPTAETPMFKGFLRGVFDEKDKLTV